MPTTRYNERNFLRANILLLMLNASILIFIAFVPDSFYIAHDDAFLSTSTHFHTFAYYAFINMTTVGFGDIIPVNDAGRALAVLLAVTGPLYIAIVISLLVGKYAATK